MKTFLFRKNIISFEEQKRIFLDTLSSNETIEYEDTETSCKPLLNSLKDKVEVNEDDWETNLTTMFPNIKIDRILASGGGKAYNISGKIELSLTEEVPPKYEKLKWEKVSYLIEIDKNGNTIIKTEQFYDYKNEQGEAKRTFGFPPDGELLGNKNDTPVHKLVAEHINDDNEKLSQYLNGLLKQSRERKEAKQ